MNYSNHQDGGVIGLKRNKTLKKPGKQLVKKFSVECFKKFIAASSISFLNKGTYGKAFLVKINNKALSPYIDLQENPVPVIIVKVGLVSTKQKQNPVRSEENNMMPMLKADFDAEHTVQEIIFRKSLKTFNSALSPGIVYLDILTTARFKMLYPKLFELMAPETNNRFSLIGMETYSNVDTMTNIGLTSKLKGVCFQQLLRLGALGYAHGDPSLDNIIVDKDVDRPYLIDFGNPQKLSEEETDFVRSQLTKVTDLPRVLSIILKGFPLEFANDPRYETNWSWVSELKSTPAINRAFLATFGDDGWAKIV